MLIVLVIIFAVTTVICAIGWFLQRISAKAVLKYIVTKGWPLPTRDELDKCVDQTIYDLFAKKN